MRSVWGATHHWPKGVGYWMPTDAKVGDFVHQKLDPIINHLPPEYAATNTDNIGMKSLAKGDMFTRGISSEANRQSVSTDANFLDERDLMTEEEVDDVQNRAEDSDYKIWCEISRPSTPGWGIDASFENSSQNFWMMKCQGCNKNWNIEESWPECVRGSPLRLACPKCGKAANVLDGRWVPKKESDVAGYTLNGVLNPHADLKKLMERFDKKVAVFWRANMGVPYMEKGAGLQMKAIMALCGTTPRADAHRGPTFAGSDVGNEGHTVILAPGSPLPKVVAVFRWTNWSDLDAAMTKYNIGTIVVDALPEKRLARAFCKRWPGRAFMCFYDRNRRGAPRWDEKERVLSIDRTESLDASHTPLYTGGVILPRADIEMREFAKQCENEVRIEEELPDGNTIFRWHKRGADHYRHGFNYGWAALSKMQFKTITG